MQPHFTPLEAERIGMLINNIAMFAAQVVHRNVPEFARLSVENLMSMKVEDEALLKRLDEMARQQGDESSLRLIEDLAAAPADMLQSLNLVRRCAMAVAFLGHCIATPRQTQGPAATARADKRLH